MNNTLKTRWLRDPVAFIHDVLRDPETGKPFELYPEQITFLRQALTLTPALTLTSSGRLPFPELVYSAPKKSGKTAIAAMIAIYCAVVIGGPYAEVYCLANDFEQSTGRVFQAAARIVESSPLLRHTAKVVANKITFVSTGSFIQACASDYSGFAGANPTLTICDELWGFTSESSRRLFDESVPSPGAQGQRPPDRHVRRFRGREHAAGGSVQARPQGRARRTGSVSHHRQHADVLDASCAGAVAVTRVARPDARAAAAQSISADDRESVRHHRVQLRRNGVVGCLR